MSELFEIEESLSPRMKWIRAMDIRTGTLANDPSFFAYSGYTASRALGRTESEAIDNLAEKLGVVNWEVKP